jgi:hypothetical protein
MADLPEPAHEVFDGPIHAVGHDREGWGFRCECGYRSPLYPTTQAAREAMAEHGQHPPPVVVEARRWLRKKKGQERWPGWPNERRRRFLQ